MLANEMMIMMMVRELIWRIEILELVINYSLLIRWRVWWWSAKKKCDMDLFSAFNNNCFK